MKMNREEFTSPFIRLGSAPVAQSLLTGCIHLQFCSSCKGSVAQGAVSHCKLCEDSPDALFLADIEGIFWTVTNNVKSKEVYDLPKITNLVMGGNLSFEDVDVCKYAKNGNAVNIDK